MSEKNNMVIHFMDGTKVVYDFPKHTEDSNAVTSRLKKLIDMQYVIIEADGALQFYPVANIKSVQVYPLPEKIPDFVIQGAESVEVY